MVPYLENTVKFGGELSMIPQHKCWAQQIFTLYSIGSVCLDDV